MMAKSADPYVYPGTNILINKENIRDLAKLEEFERIMTAQRLREGLPDIALTSKGYCSLHHHLFQDVYAWAGKTRTVAIAKNNALFCLAEYVNRELDKRLDMIRGEKGLRGLGLAQFIERTADHIAEINAIHPFREGNGRTKRALLVVLGRHAGHAVAIQQIDAAKWNEASRISFRNGDLTLMQEVLAEVTFAP